MDYHVRYTPTAALSLRPYFLKIYARFFGLTKTQTTAFHPQSDGLVLRFRRTIKDMLSKAFRRDQRNWDDILPLLMPSEHRMMIGWEAELPVGLLYGLPPK